MYALAFLKTPLMDPPQYDQLFTAEDLERTTVWTPYPRLHPSQDIRGDLVFRSRCELGHIAWRVSRLLFSKGEPMASHAFQDAVEGLYEEMCDWRSRLPSTLALHPQAAAPVFDLQ